MFPCEPAILLVVLFPRGLKTCTQVLAGLFIIIPQSQTAHFSLSCWVSIENVAELSGGISASLEEEAAQFMCRAVKTWCWVWSIWYQVSKVGRSMGIDGTRGCLGPRGGANGGAANGVELLLGQRITFYGGVTWDTAWGTISGVKITLGSTTCKTLCPILSLQAYKWGVIQ